MGIQRGRCCCRPGDDQLRGYAVNARWTTMVHTARLTIMVCVLFSAVVSKADAKQIVIVDVDSMPIIQRQADEIDIWQKDTTESIKSWRAVEEEKVDWECRENHGGCKETCRQAKTSSRREGGV